jgi:hypothetical protein
VTSKIAGQRFLAPELLELLDEPLPEDRLLLAEEREPPPDDRLLPAEEREPPPDDRLLPAEERELPPDDRPLLTEGLDLLPEDRDLPTEPDRGAEDRPLLLPTDVRDRDVGARRLDEPDGDVVGRL